MIAAVQLAWTGEAVADEKREALKLLNQGDKYLEKAEKRRASGRESRAIHYYEKALDAYKQAYQLVPNPQIFYAIANAEAGLKRFEEAIAHYRQVIDEVDKPALIEAAKARIEELAPELGTIMFKLSPDGAELSCNAELLGVAPLKDPLFLPPGEHVCSVAADGYNPQEVTLTVEAGSRMDKEIALEKVSVVVKRPKDDDGDSDDPDFSVSESRLLRAPSKVVPILGAAGTGIFAIASAVTGGMSTGEDASDSLLYISIGTGIAAIGLGAYTAYHYFKVYRPRKKQWDEQISRSEPRVWLVPVVQADGGGVALGGRF